MEKQNHITLFLAVLISVVITFESLQKINPHSYSVGLSNIHSYCPKGITCCFGVGITHMINDCGQPFHF